MNDSARNLEIINGSLWCSYCLVNDYVRVAQVNTLLCFGGMFVFLF